MTPRTTARVLPVDADGRVLLLHGWDPRRPEAPYWFTIGGATEPGESLAQAGARELYEETGITVSPADLGERLADVRIEFSRDGRTIVQDQAFFAVQVVDAEVTFEHQDHDERATISAHGWWTADALEESGMAAHERIPELMRLAVGRVSGRGRL